jgi:type IV pilus assembly protein PilB
MVGEIRDLETAETAINAALTGHLVISTIHTNNAPAAIPRLLAMGVKPFLLAPALNLVIGQRLARKICDDCKIPFNLPSDILEQVKQELAKLPPPALSNINLNNLTFYIGRGCPKCSGLGLKGRIGLYELFQMDEEINAVIQTAGLSEYKIQELAKTQGMVTMVQDGLLKALDGITSVEEVYRVIE